jgi:hypothetical protein
MGARAAAPPHTHTSARLLLSYVLTHVRCSFSRAQIDRFFAQHTAVTYYWLTCGMCAAHAPPTHTSLRARSFPRLILRTRG